MDHKQKSFTHFMVALAHARLLPENEMYEMLNEMGKSIQSELGEACNKNTAKQEYLSDIEQSTEAIIKLHIWDGIIEF